jgi:hypothetical protein
MSWLAALVVIVGLAILVHMRCLSAELRELRCLVQGLALRVDQLRAELKRQEATAKPAGTHTPVRRVG